eukprot:7128170-Prymnesium_polylepis.1
MAVPTPKRRRNAARDTMFRDHRRYAGKTRGEKSRERRVQERREDIEREGREGRGRGERQEKLEKRERREREEKEERERERRKRRERGDTCSRSTCTASCLAHSCPFGRSGARSLKTVRSRMVSAMPCDSTAKTRDIGNTLQLARTTLTSLLTVGFTPNASPAQTRRAPPGGSRYVARSNLALYVPLMTGAPEGTQ